MRRTDHPAPQPEDSRQLLPAEIATLQREVRSLWLWILVAPIAASPVLYAVLFVVVAIPAARLAEEMHWDLGLFGSGSLLACFALVHLVYQAVSWPQLLRLRRDVREARALAAKGTIRWRTGWGVEVDSRWMPSIEGDLWKPQGGPGRGIAHYLPHSRLVLSWEPLPGADSHEHARSLYQEAHAQLFRCEPAWLARNRSGALAPGQRWQLALRAAGWLVGGAFAVPVSLLPFWGERSAYLYGALGSLVAVGCWAWASRFVRDAVRGVVAVAEGAISVRTTPRTRTSSVAHYFDAGGSSFAVIPRASRAIEPGRAHRLFYAPRSAVIVGVEAVDAR